MTKTQGIVIGCAVAALVGIAALVGVGAFLHHVSQDPEGMRLALEVPDSVSVEQELTLVVVVSNDSASDILRVGDVDVSADYLGGFIVLGTDPPPKSSMDVPLVDSRSFTFGVEIPPREERRFTFRLRATTPGTFRGDVDVWQGTRFLTMVAETRVLPQVLE